MGVDEEFERVRTALRTEEQALARELDQIDAEARATVDASVEHVRTQLATQADRIREAIAQQREEVEARQEELRDDEAEWTAADDAGADGGLEAADDADADGGLASDDDATDATEPDAPTTTVEQVTTGTDEPDDLIGDVERGD